MSFLLVFFGFLFGYFLIQARLNRYDTISGMATLEDFTVPKVIMTALGIGTVLVSIIVAMGAASFGIRPLIPGTLIVGGLIFGAGMAILGYCPGTLMISLGEGSLDALAGIAGGICGGVLFYYASPYMTSLNGVNLGQHSLHSLTGGFNILYFAVVFLLSFSLVYVAFLLNRFEKRKNLKWLYSGLGLAVLNGLMIMDITVGQPMSASSLFPWMGGHIFGLTETEWFGKLNSAGNRLVFFLGGAMVAGFIFSILRKEFKFSLIHSRWAHYKGNSPVERLIFAFAGGFLLLFGARMAGGCTSGHVISGGMQVAFSSYLFAVFAFAGLLTTGYLFYRKRA